MLFSSYNCIVVPWLVLGEKSSSGVLNLQPLPRENRPRPKKCKDSENDSVTLQPRKNVHILGAENVQCSKYNFVHWQTGNTKVHRSTDLSMQRSHKSEVFSRNTKLA